MTRLRVAHVITRLCKGGAQENTFHTVRLANRDTFDVDLVSGPTEECEGSIEDTVAAAGIRVLRVPALVREVSPFKDLAVGRLEPIKGFTYFVDAARRVAQSVPDAVFVLAGQGSLEASLRAQAAPPSGRFPFLGPRDDGFDRMVMRIEALYEDVARRRARKGETN